MTLQLPARFNVANALAALGPCRGREARPGWQPPRPGRRPRRPRPDGADRPVGQPFGVVVDYAHTADSLARCSATCPLTAGRLRRVRVGRRPGPDQAGAHGRRRRRAGGPRDRHRRGPPDRGPVGDQRGDREGRARPEPGIGRRCGSSTTVARRSPMRCASPSRGTWCSSPARATSPSIIYGDDRRWWDEREVARQELRDRIRDR